MQRMEIAAHAGKAAGRRWLWRYRILKHARIVGKAALFFKQLLLVVREQRKIKPITRESLNKEFENFKNVTFHDWKDVSKTLVAERAKTTMREQWRDKLKWWRPTEGSEDGSIEIPGPGPGAKGLYQIPGWMPYFEKIRDYHADCVEIIEEYGEVAARESFAVVAVHDYRLTKAWIESRKKGLKDMYVEILANRPQEKTMETVESKLMNAWPDDMMEPTREELSEVIDEFEDELRHFIKHEAALKKWLDALNAWLRFETKTMKKPSKKRAQKAQEGNNVIAELPLHVPVHQTVPDLVNAFKKDMAREREEEKQRAKHAELEEQRRKSREAYAKQEREVQEEREKAKGVDRLNLWCRRHRIEQQTKKELFEASILQRARGEKLRAERQERQERAQRAIAQRAQSVHSAPTLNAHRPDRDRPVLTNEEKAHREGFANRCKPARSRDFDQRQVMEKDAAAERRRTNAIQKQKLFEAQKSKHEAMRTHSLPSKPTLSSIIDVALTDQVERTKIDALPVAHVVPFDSASDADLQVPVVVGSAVPTKR